MERSRIAELLAPFTAERDLPVRLLEQLQRYLDLLLRWNKRINLTAVRQPEQVVARHFGESLFAAQVLFPAGASEGRTLTDVGSGAGFPGVPIKLLMPRLELTLIESQNKKAAFLRELVRTLGPTHVQVFCGRAEQWQQQAEVVTLRAVERFECALPVAAGLVKPGGRLCLLIASAQLLEAQKILGADWTWEKPAEVPQSSTLVVLVGALKDNSR
jgi:16S rRNA (guanine527-N7)-methyltransferase